MKKSILKRLSNVLHEAFEWDTTAVLEPVRVIVFAGGWNLPLWVAQKQGFFHAQGVDVRLSYAANSSHLIQGLLSNQYDIGIASIDNLIACQEGQCDTKVSQPDLFAFMGYDNGFLSLVAAPSTMNIADLKGKTISVDALNTGFVYVLREILARAGIQENEVKLESVGGTQDRYLALMAGKHDATLLRVPFTLLAKNQGFHELATISNLYSAYQGSVGMARRSWARQHESTLMAYMHGYRAAIEWLYDPKNRIAAQNLLMGNITDITDMTFDLAIETVDQFLGEQNGLFRNCALDIKGIETVLMLRSKYADPQKVLHDPMKYVDLSYYKKSF